MKTTLCIQVGLDSTHVDEPSHIPPIGSTVEISQGGVEGRLYKGIVISVLYDYSVEGELHITVVAR